MRAHEWSIDYYWFIYRSVERLGVAGERRRGDRGPVIAGTRNLVATPSILAPDQTAGISHHGLLIVRITCS